MSHLFDDGVPHFMSAGSSPVAGTPVSISAICRTDDRTQRQFVCTLQHDSGDSVDVDYYALELDVTVPGAIVAEARDIDQSNAAGRSSTTYKNNEWFQCGAGFSGTGAAAKAVAILEGGGKGDTNLATPSSSTALQTMIQTYVGKRRRNGNDETLMTGNISELVVYNTFLTDADWAFLGLHYSALGLTHRLNNIVMYHDFINDIHRPFMGTVLTNSGATVAEHPPVLYPAPPPFMYGIPAVAVSRRIFVVA